MVLLVLRQGAKLRLWLFFVEAVTSLWVFEVVSPNGTKSAAIGLF